MSQKVNSLRYRTIDLLFVVLIGVAAGVAFFSFAALIGAMRPVISLFPPSEGAYAGIWAIPAAISMLIVRKPGAALGTMWIGALIEAALGSHFGWTVLISGAIVASGFEVMGLISRYGRPTLTQTIIGAEISLVIQWVWEQYIFFPTWGIPFRLVHLGLFLISAVVVLAIPSRAIVNGLAKAGALNQFAVGREASETRA